MLPGDLLSAGDRAERVADPLEHRLDRQILLPDMHQERLGVGSVVPRTVGGCLSRRSGERDEHALGRINRRETRGTATVERIERIVAARVQDHNTGPDAALFHQLDDLVQ